MDRDENPARNSALTLGYTYCRFSNGIPCRRVHIQRIPESDRTRQNLSLPIFKNSRIASRSKERSSVSIKGMQALVTGTVVIAFEITSEGAVRHAMVISGPKMLQASVLEAVRRRRYKPFLLNGKPTAVATSVSIQVTINDRGVTFRDTPQK